MVADSVVDNFPDGKALALRQDYRAPGGDDPGSNGTKTFASAPHLRARRMEASSAGVAGSKNHSPCLRGSWLTCGRKRLRHGRGIARAGRAAMN